MKSDSLPICPLCASSDSNQLEDIKIGDLDRLYRRETGYSVRSLFGDLKTITLTRCGNCDLHYFYPMVPGTQEFYENLQKFEWYYFDDKPEFDYAARFVTEGDDVLEIGAGKGAFAKKIPSNPYTGLEFSEQAIEFARANGVRLLSKSIEEYANECEQQHDVVCNFQVLEHVSDVNGFLSSSVSCLKPGGLMIVSVPAADSFGRYVRNFWADIPPHHLTRWTDRVLTNLAKQYDLELVTIHHEMLQDTHRYFYAMTIFSNVLFNSLGKTYRTIDLGFVTRIIVRVSFLLGKFFSKGLVSTDLLPRGLSLVAVYRKPIK